MKPKVTLRDIQVLYCDTYMDTGWCDELEDCDECVFDEANIETFKPFLRDQVAPLIGSLEGKE